VLVYFSSTRFFYRNFSASLVFHVLLVLDQGSQELAKVKSTLGYAISEMHWYAAKLRQYCAEGIVDTEFMDGTSVNSLLFHLDKMAEVLDQSAFQCQDAMDHPPFPTQSDVARFVGGTAEDAEDPAVDVSP
jgi:hypothetical protein